MCGRDLLYFLRPVVWDAQDVQDLEHRLPVRLRAQHFQIRNPGVTGLYHAALSAARQKVCCRRAGLAHLYKYLLACTIWASEHSHGPPRNSGISQDAWTRSTGNSRHTLSGAHDGGSRCTPSTDAWICATTSLTSQSWGTCSVPSPISRRGPAHQAFLWGLPLPIRAGPHATGPAAVPRSHGRSSAGQGQGGSGSGPSPPQEDVAEALAGGR